MSNYVKGSLREAVERIRDTFNGGKATIDSFPLFLEVQSAILDVTAVLIRRDINKNGYNDESAVQWIENLKLDKGSNGEKITAELPKTIEVYEGNTFLKAETDLGEDIPLVKEAIFNAQKEIKYPPKKLFGTFKQDRLVLFGNRIPSKVRVKAILYNPLEINNYEGNQLTIDSPFPRPATIMTEAIDLIIKNEFKLQQQTPKDEINDANG